MQSLPHQSWHGTQGQKHEAGGGQRHRRGNSQMGFKKRSLRKNTTNGSMCSEGTKCQSTWHADALRPFGHNRKSKAHTLSNRLVTGIVVESTEEEGTRHSHQTQWRKGRAQAEASVCRRPKRECSQNGIFLSATTSCSFSKLCLMVSFSKKMIINNKGSNVKSYLEKREIPKLFSSNSELF